MCLWPGYMVLGKVGGTPKLAMLFQWEDWPRLPLLVLRREGEVGQGNVMQLSTDRICSSLKPDELQVHFEGYKNRQIFNFQKKKKNEEDH